MSLISIDRTDRTPVYRQISEQIRNSIFRGLMPDGYVLPSERNLAGKLGVHRNTITKAYAELKAEALIESSQGKSYRVAFAKAADGPDDGRTRDVNWESLIESRGYESEFEELYGRSFDSGLISFAGGVADRDVYPSGEVADVFEGILQRRKDKAYFYTPCQGDPELRREISTFLSGKGIQVHPSEIQITSENNQSLDFIMSLIFSPGDRVIMDETMSADVYRTIKFAGGEVINVPCDEHGMICENLDIIIEKYSPRFIYVDSSFNNPRGTYLTLERKKKLLELSYRYRVPIIEEDEGSELYYDIEPVPPIKAMDRGNNVIYMHSFSLTMVPGIGVSFVAADSRIIRSIGEIMGLRVTSPDWAAQMLMLEYMKNGLFLKRLDDFRKVYREKRDIMCCLLDRLVRRYGIEYRKPEGGVYLWVKLPGRINAGKLLAETQKRGLTFMPGHLFYSIRSRGRSYLRLNYSYPTKEGIVRGVDILEKSIEALLS